MYHQFNPQRSSDRHEARTLAKNLHSNNAQILREGTLVLSAGYIPFHWEFHLSLCSIGTVFPERCSPFSFVLSPLCASVIEPLFFSLLGYSLWAYTNICRDYWQLNSNTIAVTKLLTEVSWLYVQTKVHQNISSPYS